MVVLAFLSLGFLIGNLIGLTSDSVVSGTIPLLFAFGGGSALGFLSKLEVKERRQAAAAVAALAISCLVGVYMGVVVSEHQLLTPTDLRMTERAAASEGSGDLLAVRKYLRSATLADLDAIDQQYRTDAISCGQAYGDLLTTARHLVATRGSQ